MGLRHKVLMFSIFYFISTSIYCNDTKKLESIKIIGLNKTKERVILDALGLEHGQYISTNDLEELKQSIENLGHFLDIEMQLVDKGSNNTDLIVELDDLGSFYLFPVPTYDSFTGIDLTLYLADSNLTGNLDNGEVNFSVGYNPANGDMPSSFNSFNFYLSYDTGNNPKFDDVNLSASLNPGWDKTGDMEELYILGDISLGFYIYKKFNASVSLGSKISQVRGSTIRNIVNIEPGTSINYSKLNSFQGGRFKEGWEASLANTVIIETLSKRVSNETTLYGLIALLPVPQINILGKISFMKSINRNMVLGGTSTGLRGISLDSIKTDNAILLNNENRLFLLNNFLSGAFSFVLFEDLCISLPSLNFNNVKLNTGTGIGIRYYPNFLSGVTFVLDVGFNLNQVSQFPEISFSFSEML